MTERVYKTYYITRDRSYHEVTISMGEPIAVTEIDGSLFLVVEEDVDDDSRYVLKVKCVKFDHSFINPKDNLRKERGTRYRFLNIEGGVVWLVHQD